MDKETKTFVEGLITSNLKRVPKSYEDCMWLASVEDESFGKILWELVQALNINEGGE